MQHGRKIDEHLDVILAEAFASPDSFYNSKKRIDELLSRLSARRESVREFEVDVEKFINAITLTGINQSINKITPVFQILNEVHSTYNHAFDICKMKERNIMQGRTTAANILLSVVAIVIAILSLVNTL